MIKKKGAKWEVRSANGKKLLGVHSTEKGARKQLAAIEAAKGKRRPR